MTPTGPAATPSGLALWVAGARPRTLPAAIVPVLVGTAAAAGPAEELGAGRGLDLARFVAALVVALAIQVGTNYANDYADGKRGTDTADRVGPLRLVGSGLVRAGTVKRAAVASFGVAAVAGLFLAAVTSWWLVPVGAVCFAAGWLYTGGPRPYGYAGWGEVFVFVFFGLVATVGSAFVQTLGIDALAVAAAVPVGLLATAILVANNLRDIPTDAVSGKHTLAVRLGDQRTRVLYVVLVVAPFLTVPFIAGVSGRVLAAASMFAVTLGRRPVQRVLEGTRGPGLIEVLVSTGRLQLVFGVLFAAGLFYGVP
jgi:1,4-dihydroxy-2-naphthoate polyprenyltransferase